MAHQLFPDKWVEQYADYLYSHAYYRLNNKELAEDLVQETFLSAFKARAQFKGEASEKTWLTSILKNKIIDVYRKNARASKISPISLNDDYFFDNEKDGHWSEQAAPKDYSISAIEKIQLKEMQASIDYCMSLLPNNWRQVSTMKLIDEESSENICKVFDITPSNFWVIMHRAKLHLRNCLEKKWIHEV